MDAMLEIRVKVQAREALATLRALDRQVATLDATAGKGTGWTRFNDGIKSSLHHMEKFGKNLQWTGRQLEYTFTLPLLLAGGMATKWALDNERAMTSVRKVYGDGTESAQQLKAETDALAKSFELLSSRFGVNQAEVIGVGAEWAQAGSAGVALAKSTRLTLEAMILGQMDQKTATEGLIAVQSIFRLNTDELREALELMNAVENQTATDMEDLIVSFQRSGGTARVAGVDIQHLAAMTAALIPSSGSASTAGNSLKTIISRIMAPTNQAADAMREMGIQIDGVAWNSMNATERLTFMAEEFQGLEASQQSYIAALVAGRRQQSRFVQLMVEMADANGFYATALEATETQEKAGAIYRDELLAYLDSTPQKFKILTTSIQNFLASAILPMLPAIAGVLQQIRKLTEWFAGLDDQTQQWILSGLLLLAVLGPFIRIAGASILLISQMGQGAIFLAGVLKTVAANAATVVVWIGDMLITALAYATSKTLILARSLLTLSRSIMGPVMLALRSMVMAIIGPIGAALTALAAAVGLPVWAVVAIIAAAIAVIVALFNDGIRGKVLGVLDDAWDAIYSWGEGIVQTLVDVGRSLWIIPQSFTDMFVSLLRVLRSGIEKAMDMLSYLNPFARHSPSMVDNVTAGVGVILDQYARLGAIAPMMRSAARAHNTFLAATAPARANALAAKRAEQRSTVAQVAPQALGAFDAQVAHINQLRAVMAPMEDQIAAQERVVKSWEAAVKSVNDELLVQRRTLQVLEDQLQSLEDQVASHKAAIDGLMDTPITGMHAYSDAIFENEMAQKRLRLEMLRLQEAGQTIEDVKDKMAKLNGEIELLRGEREGLRLAGAGSDVLGPLDDQIRLLEQQRDALGETGSEVDELAARLKELERAGEILSLEQSITFDPQIRELDILVNRMTEMPFDEILAKIQAEQAAIAAIQPELDVIKAQYDAQALVVEGLEQRHEAVSYSLDVQRSKLDSMRDAYAEIKDLVDAMESALLDSASAADDLIQKAKEAKAAAEEGGGMPEGDFEIPEGTGFLGREGGLAEIEDFNAALQEELDKALADMGDFDMFQPFKDAWQGFRDWWDPKWENFTENVKRGAERVGSWFLRLWQNIKQWSSTGWQFLVGLWQTGWGVVSGIIGFAWNSIIKPILDGIVWFYQNVLAPVFTWLWETIIKPAWEGISSIISWAWNTIIKPVLATLWNFISSYIIPIFQLIAAIVEIVFVSVTRIISWAWNNVIKPAFDALVWAIGNMGEVFKWLWNNIVSPVWNWISQAISFAWNSIIKPVFNFLWGAVQWVGEKFSWLHQTVIKPVMDAIGTAIGWAWRTLIQPIWQAFEEALEKVGDTLKWLNEVIIRPVMNAIKQAFKTAWNAIATGFESVVNGFIRGFNTIVRAVRAIAGFLHIDVTLSEMPEISVPRFMADGGQIPSRKVGSGFVTSGARAIVGEGRAAYPEYVIPTDPQYRDRALALAMRLYADLGIAQAQEFANGGLLPASAVPHLGLGDIIGGAIDVVTAPVRNVADLADEVRRHAASMFFGPALPIIDGILNAIPVPMIRDLGHKVKNAAYDWAKGDAINFAKGGRFKIPRTPGGVHMRVGEGRNDEQIQVLPYGPGDGPDEGGTVNHFHGDLIFPNVTTADDAEAFIKNLEGLAGE